MNHRKYLLSTCTLVQARNEKLLLACGPGATVRLKQSGLSLTEIDSVFLAHLHSDHVGRIAGRLVSGVVPG
jgi:ribonuclease BN (tRNA processing enzyme)